MKLEATESDLFFNDHYSRKGQIVVLGTEGAAVVAFGSKFIVDIRYPNPRFTKDGFLGGTPDWGGQVIDLGHGPSGRRARFALRAIGPEDEVAFPNDRTALYRPVGDNDIVLIYFPSSVLGSYASLELEAPTATLLAHVQQVTQIFGQEFLLVSRESWNLLQRSIEPSLTTKQVLTLAATIAAEQLVTQLTGNRANGKLVRGLAFYVISEVVDALATEEVPSASSTGVVASRAEEGQLFLFARSPLGPMRLGQPWYGNGAVRIETETGVVEGDLLLVDLFDVDPAQAAAIQEFVSTRVSVEHLRGAWFSVEHAPVQRVALFDDKNAIALNYELIANGMARLDLSDLAALNTFPEFVIAARTAVTEQQGFSARWAGDARYMRLLERAETAIAGRMN